MFCVNDDYWKLRFNVGINWPLPGISRKKLKPFQSPWSARLHYCWRNSSFRYVFRYTYTAVRYRYCTVFWGIRFAEFGVEFCEKIRQNLKIDHRPSDHPLKKFQIWYIRSDLDDMAGIRSTWNEPSRVFEAHSTVAAEYTEMEIMLVNWSNTSHLLLRSTS
jgi:hypothetical protein